MTDPIQTALYKRHVLCLDSRDRENYSATAQCWAGPGVAYAIGDRVLVNSKGYQCTTAHTSTAVFTDDIVNWIPSNVSSPSEYRIRFPALRNVKMLRLLGMELTNAQHVINHKNRFLDFLDSTTGATEHTAALNMGTYTSTGLADEINTRMNAALGAGFGVLYTVTYSTVTQRFIITRLGGATTQLLFLTGTHGYSNSNENPATVIGFVPALDTAVAAQLISPNMVNLAGENALYMIMKGYPAVTTSGAIQDVFAKIVLNVMPRNVVFNSFAAGSLVFTQPKDVIDNFEVRIVQYDGSLFDFNNVDHSYSIEAFCL